MHLFSINLWKTVFLIDTSSIKLRSTITKLFFYLKKNLRSFNKKLRGIEAFIYYIRIKIVRYFQYQLREVED